MHDIKSCAHEWHEGCSKHQQVTTTLHCPASCHQALPSRLGITWLVADACRDCQSRLATPVIKPPAPMVLDVAQFQAWMSSSLREGHCCEAVDLGRINLSRDSDSNSGVEKHR